jgi:hypothetical protein
MELSYLKSFSAIGTDNNEYIIEIHLFQVEINTREGHTPKTEQKYRTKDGQVVIKTPNGQYKLVDSNIILIPN